MSPAQFSALFEGIDWRLVPAGSGPASAARRRPAASDSTARSGVVTSAPRALIGAMTDADPTEENARLRPRSPRTEAALAEAQEAQRRLESIVAELRREKFGRASEKLDPEQFNLPLEDVEIAQGRAGGRPRRGRGEP